MAAGVPYAVHLLVVCHGLWGTRAHIRYICDSVEKYANMPEAPRSESAEKDNDEDVKLVVLAAEGNEWTHTYDGVDICAERVLLEIDEECKRIEADGGQVKRFSIVGYSLGGLVARYVLGLLESRTPSFFDDVLPVNFTTFASPAIGVPRWRTFFSTVLGFIGSRLLSRSGAQLYGRDRFLPSRLLDGNNQPKKSKAFLNRLSKKKEKAEPLLAVMADPRYSFFRALLRFERVEVYCNAVNDTTVPYNTGAIEEHDPFGHAQAQALQAAFARGESPERVSARLEEGGLEVIVDKETSLIISYHAHDLPPQLATPKRRFRLRLPYLLRPSTYPIPRAISTGLLIFLPVTLPLYLIYVTLITSMLAVQSRASRKRIEKVRAASGGGRSGMLERVGVKLREALDDATAPLQSLRDEENGGVDMDDESDSDADEVTAMLRPEVGTATPPLAKPHSADLLAPSSPSAPYPTDPILTEAQLIMIKNLNSIPQMRKHLAYFPDSMFAHGIIVARDPNGVRKGHHRGKVVVDSWAKQFRL